MASSSVADSVSGSAYASYAAFRPFHRAIYMALEKRGRSGGRFASRWTDDGPFSRGYAVHLRSDNGSGWYTDSRDDALYLGSN